MCGAGLVGLYHGGARQHQGQTQSRAMVWESDKDIKCWQGTMSTNARDDFLRFRGLTGAAAVESPATETAASASPGWAAAGAAASSLRSSKSDMADV